MKNILIYNSGGGLGDSIQLFDLVTSLKNNFKNASLFYLGAHENHFQGSLKEYGICLLYTSPSPRDAQLSRMPSSA